MPKIVATQRLPDGSKGYVLDDGRIVNEQGNVVGSTQKPPSQTDQLAQTGVNTVANQAGQQVGQQVVGQIGTQATTQGTGAAGGMSQAGTSAVVDGTSGGMSVAGSSGGAAPNTGSAVSTALPWLGLAASSYYHYNNFKEDGGMDVLKGDINKQNSVDAAANSNLMTAWINPIMKMVGLGTLGSLVGGKTTKQYDAKRWLGVSKENPNWTKHYNQDYQRRKNNPNEGRWTAEEDPTGKYVGQKWSWDAQKDIMESTGDYRGLVGHLGNAETFGDEFFKLSPDEQLALTERLYKEGLYVNDKGGIIIPKEDRERAHQIKAEMMGSEAPSLAQESPQAPVPPASAPQPTQGSSIQTVTPGQGGAIVNGQQVKPRSANSNGATNMKNQMVLRKDSSGRWTYVPASANNGIAIGDYIGGASTMDPGRYNPSAVTDAQAVASNGWQAFTPQGGQVAPAEQVRPQPAQGEVFRSQPNDAPAPQEQQGEEPVALESLKPGVRVYKDKDGTWRHRQMVQSPGGGWYGDPRSTDGRDPNVDHTFTDGGGIITPPGEMKPPIGALAQNPMSQLPASRGGRFMPDTYALWAQSQANAENNQLMNTDYYRYLTGKGAS